MNTSLFGQAAQPSSRTSFDSPVFYQQHVKVLEEQIEKLKIQVKESKENEQSLQRLILKLLLEKS